MLFEEMNAVYTQNHVKALSILCVQKVELLIIK